MNNRLLFNVSATIELLVGVALIIAPMHVIGWLLGDGLSSTGAAVSRVLGIGLVSLGVSAWGTARQKAHLAPRAGICTYNVGVALLLSIFGTLGGMKGLLLWPTAVVHALMGAAMLRVILAPSPESSEAS